MKQQVTENQILLLLQSDEDQLLEQLGMRTAVATRDLSRSAEIHMQLGTKDILTMGVKDDMKVLGRRILKRWNQSAFDLACGSDPNDAKTRNEVQNALGFGEAATVGALTAALISVGLMPALAPVIATLLVKRFFSPAYGEFCGYWKENL